MSVCVPGAAEQSSSQGWLVEDDYRFPDNGTAVRLAFGCETGETGEIFRQTADGILGLGNSGSAFHSQLVAQGVIEDTFALCFGLPQGGTLLLGDAPLQPDANVHTVHTPLVTTGRFGSSQYWNIDMDDVVVDNVKMNVPKVGVLTIGSMRRHCVWQSAASWPSCAHHSAPVSSNCGLSCNG